MKVMVRLLLLLALLPLQAFAREVPIQDFFKEPGFSSVSLSPTGEYITVSVPQGDRTVLAAFKTSDMSLVAKWDYGEKRHIDSVLWVNNDRFLMFVSLKLGRYDFRVGTPDVYASNVDGTQRRDMPNLGYYGIVDVTWDDPRTILVQRSVESAFLSKYDVYTGETRTVATAPLRYGSFILDNDLKVRYAVGVQDNQERLTLRRDGDKWTRIHSADMGGDTYVPVGFHADNKRVYFLISEEGKPAKLMLVDPETEEKSLVASSDNVSLSSFLESSNKKDLLAVSLDDGLPKYEFLDSAHPESKVYAGLINAFPDHAVAFRGISRDGNLILLTAYSDVDPGSYYLFDRKAGSAKFLLSAMDWIKPEEMAQVEPITVTARDGQKLHGYLTLPPGGQKRGLPLILHPHGGPYGVRDYWGFNPEVQFLANRGFAVLQVNFRGSEGYGSAFERAGYKKWGTVMLDDMADSVDWVVRQGIADKDRVCTYGASYGGYAAVQSVIRYPDKYKCSIGFVGVYSLGLLYSDGTSDTPALRAFLDRIVPSEESERQAQSPINNVAKIKVPVMLVHGGKDEVVPIVHYNRMKKAMEDAGKPPEVTLVKSNEGHGFYKLDNEIELYNTMESFLNKHIGPKAQSAAAQ